MHSVPAQIIELAIPLPGPAGTCDMWLFLRIGQSISLLHSCVAIVYQAWLPLYVHIE